MMVDLMRLLAFASTVTASPARMALSCTRARVSPKITLSADAPAPLTPTPVAPPKAMATEAARPKTWMSASEMAWTVTVLFELRLAPSREASTTPSMMLRASETPTDKAAPVPPPKAAASEAAPATARIDERSLACTSTSSASMSLGRSPRADKVVTPACTRVPIWFSAQTPEPLAARPVPPPPASAAEPETTKALMTWRPSARRSSTPPASMSESMTRARTVAIASSPTMPKPSWPIRLRATAMPMDAPSPVPEPTPTATDKAAMVALMVLSLDALSTTSPSAAVAEPLRSKASVEPLMVLTATAPAPLKARPEPPPLMPMAAEAATDTALMLLRETTAVEAAADPLGASLKVRV